MLLAQCHQNCFSTLQPISSDTIASYTASELVSQQQQMRKEELTVQVQQRPEKTTMSTRVKEEVSHQFVDDGGEEKMKIEQTNVLKASPDIHHDVPKPS